MWSVDKYSGVRQLSALRITYGGSSHQPPGPLQHQCECQGAVGVLHGQQALVEEADHSAGGVALRDGYPSDQMRSEHSAPCGSGELDLKHLTVFPAETATLPSTADSSTTFRNQQQQKALKPDCVISNRKCTTFLSPQQGTALQLDSVVNNRQFYNLSESLTVKSSQTCLSSTRDSSRTCRSHQQWAALELDSRQQTVLELSEIIISGMPSSLTISSTI